MPTFKLAKLMTDYAEAEKMNGAIITLDQEKAYDRINHTYLWTLLRKMNFPKKFIAAIRALYEVAESVVIVNGVTSQRFRITRGARQGDLMSCILFDIAIEPLADALRKLGLKGLEVPGIAERLIAKLFADDTTVYLSAEDRYDKMEAILLTWCQASRAKFNAEKTECIPVGTKEFRMELTKGDLGMVLGRTIPDRVRVVPDGQAVRILEAWLGNGTNATEPWKKVVEASTTRLGKWSRRHPTMYGRKLAVGIEVAGRTQFLMEAQGMPESVEGTLHSMVMEFV